MSQFRAVIAAVNYDDLLAVTLPYNRHHFSEVHIVTGDRAEDEQTVSIALVNNCTVHRSHLFWADGAYFAKWRALEWALDEIGRIGWLCLMDADVLWPKVAPLSPAIGELWSPLRRMAPWPGEVPEEAKWSTFPVHRNVGEWAGYSQVFHASDPHLPAPPWHEVDWKHAGGADSLFQRLWPMTAKRRPSWECLHLGEAGKNWFGRGADPALTAEVWAGRRRLRANGASEAESFRPEKLHKIEPVEGKSSE